MKITEHYFNKKAGKALANMETETVKPYSSSMEYIEDELKLLDLKLILHLQLSIETGTLYSSTLGLISAEEIFTLLDGYGIYGSDREQLEKQIRQMDRQITERLHMGRKRGIYNSIQRLSDLYGFGPFEKFCIIACLAPEINPKYQRIYGYLQNDTDIIKPSIDLVSRIFPLEECERYLVRSVFDIQAPLTKYLMDQAGELTDYSTPMITRHLKLDDWVVNYLFDIWVIDAQLAQVAQLIQPEGKPYGEMSFNTEQNLGRSLSHRISQFIDYYRGTGRDKLKKVFYFYGPKGVGKIEQVNAICNCLGLPLIIVDMERMLLSDSFEESLRRIERQALISNAAICLKNADLLLNEKGLQNKLDELLRVIQNSIHLTFILGQSEWYPAGTNYDFSFINAEFPCPTGTERKKIWEQYSGQYSLGNNVDLDKLSENFRFTQGQIKTALKLGESSSVWNSPENGLIGNDELYNSCYAQSNKKLGNLAARIKALYTMKMLVLPEEQMEQMQEICNQVKYRSLVYEKWGFEKRLSLGKGLNILFSGPPGSGKTMAAEVIANEIGLEIYKIDVSQVVSKYIGETEKNLEEVFTEAETSNAILFFDEADALFGKRSEVKDAHDRYANVEIGYLLQRMEEYDGIVILATNLNQNIDEAFLRRLHFNVTFPFPDKEQRKLIWMGIFPAGAPVDKNLDYEFLAEKFALAGGNIKNIALNAAFYAAHSSCSISIKEIMQAAKREYKKLGKTFLMSDYAPYYQLIEVKK